MFLGVDGHYFIYDCADKCDFLREFDWILCNNTIIKNKEIPETICVKIDFIPKYAELLESHSAGNFALISCGSTYSPIHRFPDETRRILANPFLVAWFSENNSGVITQHSLSGSGAKVLKMDGGGFDRRKFHSLPSGLMFHDLAKTRDCEARLLLLLQTVDAPQKTKQILYCDTGRGCGAQGREFCGVTRSPMCDFLPWLRSLSAEAAIDIHHLLDDSRESLYAFYDELAQYRFLLCPCDAWIDPFPRVWEALAVGTIPVMLRNPYLEEMYGSASSAGAGATTVMKETFPIWFVDSWDECLSSSDAFYKNTYNMIMENVALCGGDYKEKMEVSYWVDKIRHAVHLPPLLVPFSKHEDVNFILPVASASTFGRTEEDKNALQILPSDQIFCAPVAVTPAAGGEKPRITFSFCIYGDNKMYYIGLKENIQSILRWFGTRAAVQIYIYVGTSVRMDYLCEAVISTKTGAVHPGVVLFETGRDGVINMIYRYAGCAACAGVNSDFYFVRDADSIVAERDIWCIFDFMRRAGEDTTAHVIRDHFHHKSKLTGGLTGLTQRGMAAVADVLRARILDFKEGDHTHYGDDEKFLNETIYELLRGGGDQKIIVHSSFCEYPGEVRVPIAFKNTLTNFCGNVLQREPYTHFQFQYNDFDVHAQWKWCRGAAAAAGLSTAAAARLFIHTIISLNAWRDFSAADFDVPSTAPAPAGAGAAATQFEKLLYGGMMQLPYDARSKTVVYLIESFLDLENLECAMCAYRLFAYCEVDEVAKTTLFARFLRLASGSDDRKIYVMTEGAAHHYGILGDDGSRTLVEGAIYMIYGNYADDWRAYPSSRVIRRNVWFYESDKGAFFAGAGAGVAKKVLEMPGWDYVSAVYLMGLETAATRIYETMQELTRMGVNLDKLHVYRAKKDECLENAYLGATKNHLDCIEMAAVATASVAADETKHILFLEDDFVFAGSAGEISRRLVEFFEPAAAVEAFARYTENDVYYLPPKYTREYDICFLAASKMHERAATATAAPFIVSWQPCTTSSGYFLNTNTIKRVLAVVRDGYEKLRETRDSHTYCIDRYWAKLQPAGRVIIFKEKLGFQRPSISKITGEINIMLD